MGKILVVFYSRSGTTQRIAQQIADALGADLDRIEETTSRQGVLGFAISAFQAIARGLPSIHNRKDPGSYELVVLGTPVWAGSMSSPVRSYMFQQRGRLPRVAFFATMRARGAEEALQELRLMSGADDAPCTSSRESDVNAGRHQPQLDAFITQLKQLLLATRAASNAAA